MRFYVGTSGYSYSEWKGTFYPEKISAKKMLEFYGEQFDSVELNNTFRRMPTAEALGALAKQVPKTFRFAPKAPQVITHFRRLRNVDEQVRDFFDAVATLKTRLGPVLFQLPPNFKKDLPRLIDFLKLLGKRRAVAFEFRHESWFEDDVYAALRKNSCALCLSDTDELPRKNVVSTARFGYVRLRRVRYTGKQLAEWARKLRAQKWSAAYVFFKHEDSGSGPKLAKQFLKLAGE